MGQRAEWATNEVPHYPEGMVKLLVTEFCERFVHLMRGAMCVSHFKYNYVHLGYPEKANALASLEDRIAKYKKTGNVEYMVDVANFAMIEFMHPAHPSAHYTPTDSSGSTGVRGWLDSAAEHGVQHDLRFLAETTPEELKELFGR